MTLRDAKIIREYLLAYHPDVKKTPICRKIAEKYDISPVSVLRIVHYKMNEYIEFEEFFR